MDSIASLFGWRTGAGDSETNPTEAEKAATDSSKASGDSAAVKPAVIFKYDFERRNLATTPQSVRDFFPQEESDLKVINLRGTYVSGHAAFAAQLLARAAPHIETLAIKCGVEHAEVIRAMPRLRYLRLHYSGEPVSLKPYGGSTLRGLDLLGDPLSLLSLSLLEAHAATLQDLHLACGMVTSADLLNVLKRGDFSWLRRVVLNRQPALHETEVCARQVREVRAALWRLPLPAPDVLCRQCHPAEKLDQLDAWLPESNSKPTARPVPAWAECAECCPAECWPCVLL